MDFFEPSRAAGLRRLADFVPAAALRYGAERNFVRAGHPDVSRLSPWLQRRLLLEPEVIAAVLRVHPFPAVEKFVQEVCWRTYWKGWLEARPAVWTRFVEAVPRLRETLSADERARVDAAVSGRTGIACFDAWAGELVATGYLHNHARMWFASIWVFTLRLPWELGAAFFHAHLLDGDPASNLLSWRWVAGLHTRGKTYLARADNIARYTEGRFSPRPGELASEAFEITEAAVPAVACEEPRAATGERGTSSSTRVGVWLHGDDLAIEHGELRDGPVVALVAGGPASLAEGLGWSAAVEAFATQALQDGARRAAEFFNLRPCALTGASFAEEMVAWARVERLEAVRAFLPAIGPWRDAARSVEAALAEAGVRMEWRRRAFDVALHPHASRGFFPFWERARAFCEEQAWGRETAPAGSGACAAC